MKKIIHLEKTFEVYYTACGKKIDENNRVTFDKKEINCNDCLELIYGSKIHKLAVAHWDYVKGIIINSESNINQKLYDIIGFHYITAFKHGYKHGKNDKK